MSIVSTELEKGSASHNSVFGQRYFCDGRNYYDGLDDYERSKFRRFYRDFFLQIAMDFLALGDDDKKVLDIGTATGVMTEKMAEIPHTESFGIDISQWALSQRANQDSQKTQNLAVADALDLPFDDEAFDGLFSLFVFEHIRGSQDLIQECFRVLKPGGRAIFLVDTVKGKDDTHTEIHPRGWWAEKFKENGFEQVPSVFGSLSKAASCLPNWQTGFWHQVNPGCYSGLFLLEKPVLRN